MAEISLNDRLRARQSRKFWVWTTLGAAGRLALPNHHQAVRSGEWERTQQHGVHHAENRGGGADAECEYGDGGDGEGRRFAQRADGEPRVARHTFQRAPAPGFAGGLADLREVAEIAPRARGVLPALAAQLRFLLQVKAQFFVEFALFASISARTSLLPPTHGYTPAS